MTTTVWNPPAPWRGLRRRPVSHPVRGTAWRAALLSLIGVPLGLLGLVALVAVLALGIALAPVGVGLGLLAVLPSFVGVLGRVERTPGAPGRSGAGRRRGGVDPDAGTGLHGLAERVAVLGGTVRVVSPSGGGTTVDVVI